MPIVYEKPKSISAEAYRTLRTNIEYSSFDKEIKAIVVTSTEPGEGKTYTATNLALSLVSDEKKVILIDCDLRKPSIHKSFNISNTVGLSEVLLGKEQIVHVIKKHESRLHILPSGKIPPNPSEMLGSSSMGNLIKELKTMYDYVIIDTPPVLAVTDSQILSTRADGTILVIRAEKTKKDLVMQSKALLNKVNANIVGVVLNAMDNKRNKYTYYYGEAK